MLPRPAGLRLAVLPFFLRSVRTAGVAVGSSLDARHGAHNLPLNTYIKWTKLRPLKFHNTSLRACSRTYLGIRVGLTPNTRHSDTPTPHRPQLTGPRDARETGEIRQRSGRPLAVPPWSPTQDRLASRLALGQARKDAA